MQQENVALGDATAYQDTEMLKLRDDDSIAFLRDEVEHGYLAGKTLYWDLNMMTTTVQTRILPRLVGNSYYLICTLSCVYISILI